METCLLAKVLGQKFENVANFEFLCCTMSAKNLPPGSASSSKQQNQNDSDSTNTSPQQDSTHQKGNNTTAAENSNSTNATTTRRNVSAPMALRRARIMKNRTTKTSAPYRPLSRRINNNAASSSTGMKKSTKLSGSNGTRKGITNGKNPSLSLSKEKSNQNENPKNTQKSCTLSRLQKDFQSMVRSSTGSSKRKPLHVISSLCLEGIVPLHRLDLSLPQNRLVVKEWHYSNSVDNCDHWIQDVLRNGISSDFREFNRKQEEAKRWGAVFAGIPDENSATTADNNVVSSHAASKQNSNVTTASSSGKENKQQNESQKQNNISSTSANNIKLKQVAPSIDTDEEPGVFVVSDMNASSESLCLIFTLDPQVTAFMESKLGHRIKLTPVQVALTYKMRRGAFLMKQSKKKHAQKSHDSTICLGLVVDSIDQIQDEGATSDYSTCKHVYPVQEQILLTNDRKRKRQELLGKSKKKIVLPGNGPVFCGIPVNRGDVSSSLCPIHHAEMVESFRSSRLEVASSCQTQSTCEPLPETYAPCVVQIPTGKKGKLLAISIDFSKYRTKEYCDLQAPEVLQEMFSKRKRSRKVNHQSRMRQYIESNKNTASASALGLHMEEESRRQMESILLKQLKPRDEYCAHLEFTNTVSHVMSNMDVNPELGKGLAPNEMLDFDLDEE